LKISLSFPPRHSLAVQEISKVWDGCNVIDKANKRWSTIHIPVANPIRLNSQVTFGSIILTILNFLPDEIHSYHHGNLYIMDDGCNKFVKITQVYDEKKTLIFPGDRDLTFFNISPNALETDIDPLAKLISDIVQVVGECDFRIFKATKSEIIESITAAIQESKKIKTAFARWTKFKELTDKIEEDVPTELFPYWQSVLEQASITVR
jgi:hypothetical protein